MLRSIYRSAAVLALAVAAIGSSVAPASAQYYWHGHHWHHRVWVAGHWGPYHHWVPAHYIYR